MSDQAQKLRELVNSLSPARTISITSGKGGVGKTNIVVNLALAMAKQGKEVAVVDADLGLANIDVLLNINPRYNLFHVIERHKRLEEIIIEGPLGIKIVPGASGIPKIADAGIKEKEYILEELSALDYLADIILIDTSAGITQNVISFVTASDLVLIVTTPEPTAVTDAYAMIKVISQKGKDVDIRLLVNMAANKKEAEDIHSRIAMVCRQFLNVDIGFAGFLLKDDSVVHSVLQRRPFILEYPYSPAGKSITRIAKDILLSVDGSEKRESWIQKILGVFYR